MADSVDVIRKYQGQYVLYKWPSVYDLNMKMALREKRLDNPGLTSRIFFVSEFYIVYTILSNKIRGLLLISFKHALLKVKEIGLAALYRNTS